MSAESKLCRELWAAIDRIPQFTVASVIVSSKHFRWVCVVKVPWETYGRMVASMDHLDELRAELSNYEESQRAAVEAAKIQATDAVLTDAVVVAQYSSGERQLGLF